MQESMQARLDLPDKLPRWATDAGVTLEPDSADKDVGWGTTIRPPTRWMNWIQNTVYEWVRRIGFVAVGNWNNVHDASFTDDAQAIIYHPEIRVWQRFDDTGPSGVSVSSSDGKAWIVGTALGGQPTVAAIDSLRFIVGFSNGNVQHSTSSIFGSPSTVTPGVGGGNIGALETAYPDSNLILAGGSSTPQVRIANDVTSAWSSATTQPTERVRRFMRIGVSSWLSVNSSTGGTDATCYQSDDDGDNWTQLADIFAATSIDQLWHGDVNVNGQTVVAVGDDGAGNGVIAYSGDMGNTWQDAVFSDLGGGFLNDLKTIYYCGGDLWVAAGNSPGPSAALWVSTDDARTWQPATIDYGATADLDDFRDIGCNGRFLIVAGFTGAMYRSLAIVGSPKNVTPF